MGSLTSLCMASELARKIVSIQSPGDAERRGERALTWKEPGGFATEPVFVKCRMGRRKMRVLCCHAW